MLSDYFLQKFNAETGRKIKGFTPAAKEQLLKYLWPGNVRELKNVIERAVVLCRGQEIDADDLLLTKLATAGDTEVPDGPGKFQADFAGRRRAPPHLRHSESHRLEQEQNGRHPRHRTLDARPQNPPLRTGRSRPGIAGKKGAEFPSPAELAS